MGKFVRQNNKRFAPKKVSDECYFSKHNTKPDYKDVLILRRFITPRGKILVGSLTGLTAKNQRMLSTAIKNARFMALLPYTDRHAL
ncbi:30S ribosomal protein S18 [Patescibacteria group bacterium]|nr:30S ribosomal protein S18 [Patescibacteria group bacterium]HOM78036.1 30S ribosomal protein S18 [bacterium]